MNTINKSLLTLEMHGLQLSYAHLRVPKPSVIERLLLSIQQHGQLVPVIVVPGDKNQWILMDGYLRAKALQRLGQDVIAAESWDCQAPDALLNLLKERPSRNWEVFEEALWLRELCTIHGLSQHALAKRIGRDQSFISRRLALIEHLPESILAAISNGKLSLWVASRVLAPMARAIVEDAEILLKYLTSHHHSSRELHHFYCHYQRSNRYERSKMLSDPALFFKAQQFLMDETIAVGLREGPEGKWQTDCKTLTATLARLLSLMPHVFSPHQSTQERHELINFFKKAETQYALLTKTLEELHSC